MRGIVIARVCEFFDITCFFIVILNELFLT